MSLVLLLEGDTEAKALRPFIQRWLHKECGKLISLVPINMRGSGTYVRELKQRVDLISKTVPEVKGIFGLLDLYGLDMPYPKSIHTARDRMRWAKAHLEERAGNSLFRQHFAVHDVEAWLLSDPTLFPREVSHAFPKKITAPESVNFQTPPAELIKQTYLSKINKGYKKTTDGPNMFNKLDPHHAASKCPALMALLQDMLAVAKSEG